MSDNLPAVQQVSVMEVEPISPSILAKQVKAIGEAMNSIMKEDVHYGKIPGTDKPTLLQPGAQKIGLMFRLAPSFGKPEVIDLPNNHREVRVICTLTSPNGTLVGQGVGVCSTMESKYRYRGNQVEFTDVAVPKDFWEHRNNDTLAKLLNDATGSAYTGKQVQAKKNDSNQWVVCVKGEKQENPDIADTYNTVLKMAAKRAHVHAILAATGASDMFTQDVEDMQSHEGEPQAAKKADAAPQRQAEVVKHPSSKSWEDYKYRYHLPLKKEGVDMDAVRASIKAKGWRFNPDDKHWYSDDYSEKLGSYIRPLDGKPVAVPTPKKETTPQQTVALSEDDDLPAWDFNDQEEGMPNI